ncbi:hypothetical protein E2C01_051672 [Portunus trituberculatus]|uniref:Uncharacterized protein n=1 Tax=Portunus trituberculatus TaxID=210409 RepID=A0A5B7GJZ2_PORTR|nr:hypothetical protein [Portunus trituberculatus]
MFLRALVLTSSFSGCGVLRSARLELGTTKLSLKTLNTITLRKPDGVWIAVLGASFHRSVSLVTASREAVLRHQYLRRCYMQRFFFLNLCRLWLARVIRCSSVFLFPPSFSGSGVLRSARLELGTTKLICTGLECSIEAEEAVFRREECVWSATRKTITLRMPDGVWIAVLGASFNRSVTLLTASRGAGLRHQVWVARVIRCSSVFVPTCSFPGCGLTKCTFGAWDDKAVVMVFLRRVFEVKKSVGGMVWPFSGVSEVKKL